MSGFRPIKDSLIDIGRSASQILWLVVRNNFISHEARLLEIESSLNSVPSGLIFEYAGATAPTGYLLCDGSVVGRAQYADLFAIVSTSFNTGGEAGGDFRLPDFRGRAPMGSGTGSGLTARALAGKVGAETVALDSTTIATHSHAVTDPTHLHYGSLYDTGVFGGPLNAVAHETFRTFVSLLGTPTRHTSSGTTGLTVNSTGSGTAHNNVQPSLVLNFIVKT